MKKQIVRVSLVQNAKLMAALYLVISIPMVALMVIPLLMQDSPGTSVLALVLMPVLYTAFGFVLTLIGAWVYNMLAARLGGFEFTTAEIDETK